MERDLHPRLTPTERIVMEHVEEMTATLERPPTQAEIGSKMGITKSGVQRHMDSLRRMGAIEGPRLVGGWRITALGKKLRRRTEVT